MTTARQSLYQYDYEQQLQILGLELPEVFQADFCNAGDASTVSMLGENSVVDIPAQFIADGRDILTYVFYYDEATGGKTRAEITITVMARPERTDEQPTPEQESIIDQAIAALNEGVERAENAAEAAAESATAAATAKTAAEAARDAALTAKSGAEAARDAAVTAKESAEAAHVAAMQSASEAEDYAGGAETAKNAAEEAAEHAEQAASTAGYMFFYIDERGHLIYQRTSNTQVDFYLENGHLYVEAIA
jgi:type IV secretory pathway VirB10-like protein